MWANPQNQKPIKQEKIRKAQWTPENTQKTQAVVDQLSISRRALIRTTGAFNNNVADDILAAMKRFRELDGAVVVTE